jgi:hypothetical protein
MPPFTATPWRLMHLPHKSVRGIIRATEGAGTGSAARACKALGEVEELGVKLCPLG